MANVRLLAFSLRLDLNELKKEYKRNTKKQQTDRAACNCTTSSTTSASNPLMISKKFQPLFFFFFFLRCFTLREFLLHHVTAQSCRRWLLSRPKPTWDGADSCADNSSHVSTVRGFDWQLRGG